ncbi:aldehyde dehydrogenase [Salmonella enterica subsp. enterica]|uniref:Aldehyde dehydrogenase n=1 Tax=Salmonella enterica I TaxID=59201 RepID=A0A447TYF6_SALET|nr:aldehyde dehydrogenase [Salmonella enterica subsp. enterica]
MLLKNIDERGKGTVSRDWVGRDAGKIAAAIGLNVPDQTRLLFVETPANHPFAVTEMMMPVLAGGAGPPTSKKPSPWRYNLKAVATIRRRCTRAISTT